MSPVKLCLFLEYWSLACGIIALFIAYFIQFQRRMKGHSVKSARPQLIFWDGGGVGIGNNCLYQDMVDTRYR